MAPLNTMTGGDDVSARPAGPRVPAWVWLVALLAGALHMAPFAIAELQTPPGWTFTGNLSSSPDYMQYRTWSRQTQVEGPIVSNRFTAEPNGRYLPVPMYWAIGRLSRLTGLSPEWVNAWLGVPLAIALVLLLYVTARRVLPSPTAVRWSVGTILLGGGLGAFLVLVRETVALRQFHPLYVLFVEPMEVGDRVAPFEAYRGNYVVQALFDTHFLVYWVACLAAILVLLSALRRPTGRVLASLGLVFAAATALHVYEGITLMAITIGAATLATRRGLDRRDAIRLVIAAGIGVVACFVPIALLERAAHLPAPTWRGLTMPPMIVLLGYPAAWLLIALGGARYWRRADREEAALVGWALGCLALVLSGPFFPYPDRGTMTLQVPLYLIAAGIYFRERTRVPLRHALLLIVLVGPTTVLIVHRLANRRFAPGAAHSWILPAHRDTIEALRAASQPGDLLLADEVSLRWLGPEYEGRHYAGHFFLTVRYDDKHAALEEFLDTPDPEARREFLRQTGATWLFVPAEHDPDQFSALDELVPLLANDVGTLFRVDTARGDRSSGADAATD